MVPGGATSVLDSPVYRSSKWMSIPVWLLVSSVTLLGSSQLLHIYMGYADSQRLPILLLMVFVILPASCYAWILMGVHIRSETIYYNSGYRHGSRLVTWMFTPKASQLMMLTAAFCPLGIIMFTLLDVLDIQWPSLGAPSRLWAMYLLNGCFGGIAAYFSESIGINLILFAKLRFGRKR